MSILCVKVRKRGRRFVDRTGHSDVYLRVIICSGCRVRSSLLYTDFYTNTYKMLLTYEQSRALIGQQVKVNLILTFTNYYFMPT